MVDFDEDPPRPSPRTYHYSDPPLLGPTARTNCTDQLYLGPTKRTNYTTDQLQLGPTTSRTNYLSDQLSLGPTTSRTNYLSDQLVLHTIHYKKVMADFVAQPSDPPCSDQLDPEQLGPTSPRTNYSSDQLYYRTNQCCIQYIIKRSWQILRCSAHRLWPTSAWVTDQLSPRVNYTPDPLPGPTTRTNYSDQLLGPTHISN
jgi:hypothetical protein